MARLSGKQSLLLLILIVILSIVALLVFNSKSNAEPAESAKGGNFRYVQNDAFGYGEKLNYKVKYGFVTAGEGSFEILPKPVTYNGRECYDIRFQVSSLKSLEWIYKVRDAYRSVLDVGGIFPWRFEQHVREGNYKRDFKADFDQVGNYAITSDKKIKVPPYVHDIVSAFFYVRTMDLSNMKNGNTFYLKNFFGDTTYNLGVKILRRETVEVAAGKFKCIVIEPLVVEGGLFKSEGSIFIYVTDDARKIPVKVATKVLIGYVTAELYSYNGTRGPVTAKIQ